MKINQLSQIRVLLIASSPKEMLVLEKHLKCLSFTNLYKATEEAESFEYLAEKNIQLVIGLAAGNNKFSNLIPAIRGNDKTYKVPVVLISESINPNKIRQALSTGVTEYLVPPFTHDILQERLTNAIKLPIRNNSHYFIQQSTHKNFTKSEPKDLTLLVVDDITENIELVRGIVHGHYHLKAAKNADMAMKICLSDSPPDLILLDIMMPDTDGLTFCKMLKHNPLTQDIAVIFVSAMSGTDNMIRGLELGAIDYITKPINPELFLARINMHAKLIIEQYRLKNKINKLEQQ